MRLHVFADFEDVGILVGGGEIGFLHVAGEDRRLVGEQEERLGDDFFLRRELDGERGLAGVETRFKFFEHGVLGERRLCRRAWRPWRRFSRRFLHGFEIGEDEFGVDDFDVAHGIDAAGDVMDVRVLEAAHDLHDGVHFADVGEKFVAETFALRRAFDEAGDVHELDRRRDDDVGFGDVFAALRAARPAR